MMKAAVLLAGLLALGACAGVSTGVRSPCAAMNFLADEGGHNDCVFIDL